MRTIDDLLGQSASIAVLREQVRQLLERSQKAGRLPPILLQGETGTGKSLLARLLHHGGPRAASPFVDVSCAAIPENLFEAELFGFERGAFTDARQSKAGLLRSAHEGTVFLDELALLPETCQAKLLKVLEDRAVRRLGSTRAEMIDIQIMAASNQDLAVAVSAGRFREDLYHRVAAVTLTLPPLRERRGDILLLAEYFLSRACAEYGLAPPRRFTVDAETMLREYHWPGNIRQLINVVERAVLLADGSAISPPMLGLSPPRSKDLGGSSFYSRIGELEREQLLRALQGVEWNISRAAALLGISRSRLRYRMEKHQLRRNQDLISRTKDARPKEVTPQTYSDDKLTNREARDVRCESRRLALLQAELVSLVDERSLAAQARSTELITEKIHHFGGRVQQSTQTKILGAFGLDAVENPPDGAALTALAIQRAARRAQGLGQVCAMRMAIHAAQVTIEQVSGIARLRAEALLATEEDLTALLDCIPPNSIAVSATAAPFLDRRFELVPQRHDPVIQSAYRLIGPEQTGFGLGGRALTRFVGRQRELTVLCEQLARVKRGRGRIVGVLGHAGVGKSRLIYELTRTDRIHGWRVLSCRGAPSALTTPLLPVTDLLKAYFDIEDRDDANEIAKKVISRLVALDPHLEAFVTPLLSVLDIDVTDAPWQSLEPVQRRLRTFDACKRLILRESQVQPVLLVFEDLHWIDNETLALLESLTASLGTAHVLLLTTYRPEFEHCWSGNPSYTQLGLEPLPNPAARAMLDTLLGDDVSLANVRRLLIERTKGNPLFLEESARTLVETAALSGRRGAYKLTEPVDSIQIPATVKALLAARIERLSQDDRRIIHAAAVIGKDVPYRLLHLIVGASDELLQQRLRALQAADFLYEKSFAPDLEYTFKHALTHEVAYEHASQEERKTLHLRIMEAIETLYRDRLNEHVERLGLHATRGEAWDKAIDYFRRASEKAIGRSANREAWAHIEHALGTLSLLPRTRTNLEQAVDLRLAVRTCLSPLGEFTRALELVQEAEPLALALDDPYRQALVHCSICVCSSHMGLGAQAIAHGERGLKTAELLREPMLRIAARHSLALPHWFRGAYRTAIALFQRDVGIEPEQIPKRLLGASGAQVFQETFTRVSYCHSLTVAAFCFAELGEFEQAMLHARQAVEFAEAADLLYLRAIADAHLAAVYLRRGEIATALELAQLWQRRYARADLLVPQLVMAARLGEVFNLSGHVEDGIELFNRAWEFAQSKRVLAFAPQVLSSLADAYCRAGRFDEALTTAKRALAMARDFSHRGDEARALFAVANIERGIGRTTQARNNYRGAAVLAGDLGMLPLREQCDFGLLEL